MLSVSKLSRRPRRRRRRRREKLRSSRGNRLLRRRRLRKRPRSRDKLRSVLEFLKDKSWLGKLPLLREKLKRLQDAKEKPTEEPS